MADGSASGGDGEHGGGGGGVCVLVLLQPKQLKKYESEVHSLLLLRSKISYQYSSSQMSPSSPSHSEIVAQQASSCYARHAHLAGGV